MKVDACLEDEREKKRGKRKARLKREVLYGLLEIPCYESEGGEKDQGNV